MENVVNLNGWHRGRRAAIAIAAVAVLGALGACGKKDKDNGGGGGGGTAGTGAASGNGPGPATPSKDAIVIGHFASMTGSEATFGISTDNAIKLAIKERNAKGGVKGRK